MPTGGTLVDGHDGDAKGTTDSRGPVRVDTDVASTISGVEPAAAEAAASIASAQGVPLSDEQKQVLGHLKQELTSGDAAALEKSVQGTRWPASGDIDIVLQRLAHIHPADRLGVARMFEREVNSGESVPILDGVLDRMSPDMIHDLYTERPMEAKVEVKDDGSVALWRSGGATLLTIPFIGARETAKTAASIIGIWANLLTTGEVGKSGATSSFIAGLAGLATAITGVLDSVAAKGAGEVFNIDFVENKSKSKPTKTKSKDTGPSIREQEEAKRKQENRDFQIAVDGDEQMGYGVEGGLGAADDGGLLGGRIDF
jgi:hypothetical protein